MQAVMSDLCVEARGSTQRGNASFDIKAAVHDPGAAMREDRAGYSRFCAPIELR